MLNQTSSEAHKFKLTALFLNRESDKVFFGRCAGQCNYTCASNCVLAADLYPRMMCPGAGCHQLLIHTHKHMHACAQVDLRQGHGQ